MTIHWKAVKQYLTVVLFVNPLAPKVKPWAIQSFLTFDSVDRTLKSETIHWKAVEQYFTVVLFVCPILPNFINLNLTLPITRQPLIGSIKVQVLCISMHAMLRIFKT